MSTASPTNPHTESAEGKSGLSPCAYRGTGHLDCAFNAAPGREVCFWHDPDAPKTGENVAPLLERLAAKGLNLEGFQLADTNLEGCRLPGAQLIQANLQGANLFKTHLHGAHLFGANLRGTSLFKATLVEANLRTADLSDANLLGTNLKGAKLEGVEWGPKYILWNERQAQRAKRNGDHVEARKFLHEAAEIYLALLNNFRETGNVEEASSAFYRLMVVKRKLLPRSSLSRPASLFIDALCGYGERPMRVVMSWLILILLGALAFSLFGVVGGDGTVTRLGPGLTLMENIDAFVSCIYFSVITMTTTGYGDYTPTYYARPFAAAEAFAGAFLMAVFVLVFAKKLTR